MAGRYRAYPEYKDSGVEWLGDVPQSWDIWKFKHVLLKPMSYGANESALDDNPSNPRFIRITDMNPDGTLKDETFKSLPYSVAGNYLLYDEDILLARSGATVGKSFIFKNIFTPCCFAGYLIQARCNKNIALPSYVYWYCQSDQYWKHISASQIQATIQNVSAEKYGELALSIPPTTSDQHQIANFLDHETAKIDTLIEKQQQLITLLQEKRQAVISYAVTRGLNPDAPMKDSGVEWLGEVPEHWVVAGFKKYLDKIIDYRGKTPTKTDSGIQLITARNIKNGIINYTVSEEYIAESDYEDVMKRGKAKIGHLLFTTEAPLGEIACIDREDIALAQRVIKFNGLPDFVNNQYLKYFIMSQQFQHSLIMHASGSTALGIKAERLVYLKMLIPQKHEQIEIVNHIETIISKISELVDYAQKAINLLQERRTALISAAVTGKIDVRDWQPPAPSSTSEPLQ